jgi:hypothetical protein
MRLARIGQGVLSLVSGIHETGVTTTEKPVTPVTPVTLKASPEFRCHGFLPAARG